MAGNARDFHGLVADDDGVLLGLTHYVLHPHMWRPEGACDLHALFTAKPVRGRGAARAPIQAVYRAADEAGIPAVYWLTAKDNYAGRMLHDRVSTAHQSSAITGLCDAQR